MRFTEAGAGARFPVFAIAIVIFAAFPANATVQNSSEIDDGTCLSCHEGMDTLLVNGPHRPVLPTESSEAIVACVRCHDGAPKHIDDPGPGTIGNPAKLDGPDAAKICTRCHTAHTGLDNYGFDVHAVTEVSCIECHKIKTVRPAELLDDRAEFCLRCHEHEKTRFINVSVHPVLDGNVTCLSCHRFAAKPGYDPTYEFQGVCRDCHPQQGGPFLYEHEAVNAYSVEGGGCTECHAPHGSPNDRLLAQPVRQLCRQCHFPAGHESAHGGIFSEYDCRECHVDIHGSFVSRLYLDPDLPAKFGGDCYDAGCHSLDGEGGE